MTTGDGLEDWWDGLDASTRGQWLDLGDAGVAPPELGASLRQAARVTPLAAGLSGWLIPAEVWIFVEEQRRTRPPAS